MNSTIVGSVKTTTEEQDKKMLFWGCFIALVATAFGFVFRAFIMAQWGVQFGLSKTQQGEIFGVGFWPFGISIVFFSLIIDKIGYKKSMVFAFICHILSVIITIFANGYWMLFAGTFLFALGNGAVEAVINPVVATMFPREKTKWLNILHAGWPAGMVIGGLLGIFMINQQFPWQVIIAFILLPAIVYGWIIVKREFPVNERVEAGVSYLDMLKEVGILGMLIIAALCAFQLGSLFQWSYTVSVIITLVAVAIFGYYVRSLGQPLLILLLLIMIPLATTELGTDSWITDLMTPAMQKMGFQGGWVLMYTSILMALLRFYAGPIVHKLSPVGLLLSCSLVAMLGLVFLSYSTGVLIIVAATVYAFGKTFFWPTMLGVVSEQFPRGGALAINFTGAVGMMGVGVIGAVILGFVQDKQLDQNLAAYDQQNNTTLHTTYLTEPKQGLFGTYKALDAQKMAQAPAQAVEEINLVQNDAKKSALRTVAFFPALMFLCYLLLFIYFKSRGGYKPVLLTEPH
ncbi:MFS transporter [Flavihumibacter profundi]|uniref:MFS transporter n=1 Tax=Flavihumibacter profundi TaxID=2716883 RepID=UPI001CC3D604|nr:MFS transporter [Flavihumibacter profundi]MBZ5856103.1 MFS transporter [Flavihumibacter profundi]